MISNEIFSCSYRNESKFKQTKNVWIIYVYKLVGQNNNNVLQDLSKSLSRR